jgi:hypothetical protein
VPSSVSQHKAEGEHSPKVATVPTRIKRSTRTPPVRPSSSTGSRSTAYQPLLLLLFTRKCKRPVITIFSPFHASRLPVLDSASSLLLKLLLYSPYLFAAEARERTLLESLVTR